VTRWARSLSSVVRGGAPCRCPITSAVYPPSAWPAAPTRALRVQKFRGAAQHDRDGVEFDRMRCYQLAKSALGSIG
jgi:hypothetical protein